MALPSDKISTTLVGDTIGSGSNDVGTLCTHPNINKWSKWKPVRFNKVDGITSASLVAINYGLVHNSYANIDAIKAAYEANEEVMTYAKPRGSLYNEPYRLGDFRNYEHSSIQPIAGAGATQRVQNIANGQTKIVGNVVLNGNPKTGEIGWDDLGMGTRKLAMALYYRDTLVKTAVADSAGDMTVTMDTRSPLPVLEAKRYVAFLFFTNNAGTTTSSLRGIPNHAQLGYPVDVVGNLVSVSIGPRWSISNPNQIIYSVEGTNQTGSPVSLLNCSIRVRNWSNDCSSTIQQGEVLLNLGTLTLPATGGGGPVVIYSNNVTVVREQFPAWKMCWNNGGAHPNTFAADILTEM